MLTRDTAAQHGGGHLGALALAVEPPAVLRYQSRRAVVVCSGEWQEGGMHASTAETSAHGLSSGSAAMAGSGAAAKTKRIQTRPCADPAHVRALGLAIHHTAHGQGAGAVRALIQDAGGLAVLVAEQHPGLAKQVEGDHRILRSEGGGQTGRGRGGWMGSTT